MQVAAGKFLGNSRVNFTVLFKINRKRLRDRVWGPSPHPARVPNGLESRTPQEFEFDDCNQHTADVRGTVSRDYC